MDRYEIIKKIIDDWFSFKLNLDVIDLMPHLIFLYEENIKLKENLDIKLKDGNIKCSVESIEGKEV